MDDTAAARERLAQKFRLTLSLHEDGIEMMRMNLRRRHPAESDAEIGARLRAWLRHRRDADRGGADGLPVPWFQTRS